MIYSIAHYYNLHVKTLWLPLDNISIFQRLLIQKFLNLFYLKLCFYEMTLFRMCLSDYRKNQKPNSHTIFPLLSGVLSQNIPLNILTSHTFVGSIRPFKSKIIQSSLMVVRRHKSPQNGIIAPKSLPPHQVCGMFGINHNRCTWIEVPTSVGKDNSFNLISFASHCKC